MSSPPSQDDAFEWPASLVNQPYSPQPHHTTANLVPVDQQSSDQDPESSPTPTAPGVVGEPQRGKLILEEATPPGSEHSSDDGNQEPVTYDKDAVQAVKMMEVDVSAPAGSQLEEGEIREARQPDGPHPDEPNTLNLTGITPVQAGAVETPIEVVLGAAETGDLLNRASESPRPVNAPAQPPTPSPSPEPEQSTSSTSCDPPPLVSSNDPAEMETHHDVGPSFLSRQIELSLPLQLSPPPRDLPHVPPPPFATDNSALPDSLNLHASSEAIPADSEMVQQTDQNETGGRAAEWQDPRTSSFLGVFIPRRPADIPSARTISLAADKSKLKGKGKAVKVEKSEDAAPAKRTRGRPRKTSVEDKKPIVAAKKRARAEISTDEEEYDRPALKLPKATAKYSSRAKAKEKAERDKWRKGKEKGRRARDRDEGSSDEDDLALSGKETVQKSKLRPKKELTKQEKALQLIRDQRNAKNGEPSSSRRVVDISSGGERGSDRQSPRLVKKLQPHYAGALESSSSAESDSDDSSSSDSSIENFIIDESEEDSDAKEQLEEQREKARAKKQGIFFHVKPFIQWLVYVAVNPEVDWLKDDESFRTAQREIERFVTSQAYSLISSQTWTREFRRAIDSRPTWNAEDLKIKKPNVAPRCDACTLGNHKAASMVGFLSGGKYDRRTFQKILPDSDSESDASDEDDGADMTFNLAGNCITKANYTNQILHWPYHTYRRVRFFVKKHKQELVQVANIPVLPADQAKQIRRAEARMLRSEAERLATHMDTEGRISKMANEFRVLIDSMRRSFAS